MDTAPFRTPARTPRRSPTIVAHDHTASAAYFDEPCLAQRSCLTGLLSTRRKADKVVTSTPSNFDTYSDHMVDEAGPSESARGRHGFRQT